MRPKLDRLFFLWFLGLFSRQVLATIYFTNSFANITVGVPVLLSWANATASVNITLLGAGDDLVYRGIEIITSSTPGNNITWVPPSSNASIFRLQIADLATRITVPSPSFKIANLASNGTTTENPSPPTATVTETGSDGYVGIGIYQYRTLSYEETIGVGIGSAVGGILLFAGTGCFFYKRGKRKASTTPSASKDDPEKASDDGITTKLEEVIELDAEGKRRVEMGMGEERVEMPGEGGAAEMETAANAASGYSEPGGENGEDGEESPVDPAAALSPLETEESPLSRCSTTVSPVTMRGVGDLARGEMEFGTAASPAELSSNKLE
ncbi:hypothetical protein QBC47DRAFT_414836 [Echria macrotheca]|uniref:Uncharacterized protein n=1 Tax=Echria macrotheca TaxID=438768 RepID=A0AAJ0F4Y3_9PEZI|nr:hypothetical protein QBC47DRAFT_414836 [Echria macrotheca]